MSSRRRKVRLSMPKWERTPKAPWNKMVKSWSQTLGKKTTIKATRAKKPKGSHPAKDLRRTLEITPKSHARPKTAAKALNPAKPRKPASAIAALEPKKAKGMHVSRKRRRL